MQAPVQDTGNHHIPRKPRAVQKEQQCDRQLRRKPEIVRSSPLMGRNEAKITVATSIMVKRSGRKRVMGSLSGIGFA